LTSDLEDPNSWNRKALATLIAEEDGAAIRNRLRVLTPTRNLPALVHAKIILVDHENGYLGSANLSQSAMESNFELGLSLSAEQVKALESLLTFFEAQNYINDCTTTVL
jgi:phosphatidylserine/phosphatidylglycerophosphate/cardiolipin synthase-like enzyme